MSSTTARSINATAPRPVREIVADIATTWGAKLSTTGYAAKPYVEALVTVRDGQEYYGDEKVEHLVRVLLSNLSQFKGQRARELKEELRGHLPKRTS